MTEKTPLNIFWFRRDLRLADNRGFFEALKASRPVLAIFIFDTHILDTLHNKKDKRLSFIYKTLKQLNARLVEKGSALKVFYDSPLNAFETICESYAIDHVFTNGDYEPYAIERDLKVAAFLKKKNIAFSSYKDQVMFEKSEVMKADGTPYTVFTPYSKVWKQNISEASTNSFASESLLHHLYQTKSFAFPNLSELGFEPTESYDASTLPNENTIADYHLKRNLPAVEGCSGMSVHLRFGTVSIRTLVGLALRLNEKWLDELIWREFFMMILFHFPRVVSDNFKKKYDRILWRNNEAEFDLWCRGETGYHIVDAGMRELNQTGLIHNRVRMVVAGFLTKHLLIDWRWGETYFAEKLLDYELSSNNGNWQWAAGCGCDAAPYFRIFNPLEQERKFDHDRAYIRKWLSDADLANVSPIVDHAFARDRALHAYKTALAQD